MGFWGKSDEERSREKQEWHNKGQRDAEANEYHTPHTMTDQFLTMWTLGISGNAEQNAEDNEAYAQGQKNVNDR